MTECRFCGRPDNDFAALNKTSIYSEVEIAINRQGILRVRVDADGKDGHKYYTTQEIVNIKYCPMCGKILSSKEKNL